MKRFTSLLNKKKDQAGSSSDDFSNAPADSPEATVARAIRLFCESGSPSNAGEEVLHLPVIVEAAESSPAAAASAAQQIRKFLGKEWTQKPHVQYNASMLIRILCDNPGPTFTRNFDKGFVNTVKELLRSCKDRSTQQIVRETLDALEASKHDDPGLQPMFQMWRKEKGQGASLSSSPGRPLPPQPANGYQWQAAPAQYESAYNSAPGQHSQTFGTVRRRGAGLPSPAELASRIEEARNTAKILLQLVQSTPTEDLLNNELVKEFSDRCQSAQRSMQTYINCDNPAPDHDTMQTLIETNEQLSLAGSRHQRAVLAARRAMGATPSPSPEAQNSVYPVPNEPRPNQRESLLPPLPPPKQVQPNGFGPPPQTNGSGIYQPQAQGPTSNLFHSFQQPAAPPPPPPPPNQGFASAQQQEQQPPQPPQPPPPPQQTFLRSGPQANSQPSNPFVDPIEHDGSAAPIAIASSGYSAPALPPRPQQASQPGQTFSIDSEPAYGPGAAEAHDRRRTTDLENAYAGVSPQSSPEMARARPVSELTPISAATGSPGSPHRPGPGPWHPSGATPSYVHRQASAATGLTMHGAQGRPHEGRAGPVAEIDGYSEVGRREPAAATPVSATTSAGTAPSSPEVGTARQARRVDVAGTGGFRNVGARA